MPEVVGGRYTPKNGAPDPKIDEKLDAAFGTAEDLDLTESAEKARLWRELEELRAEVAEARQRVTASAAAPPEATRPEGWSSVLAPLMPDLKVTQGGIEFPQHDGPIPRGWKMIHTLLWRVMREVDYVAKAQEFAGGGVRYNFRGIDAVVNALGPAMRKHGVIPMPKVRKVKRRDVMTTSENPKPARETTVEVRYRFLAPDGSYEDAIVPGESIDHSDKGTAKAMSVAFRVVLLQVFNLPTTEPDPDSSYHTRDGVGSMGKSVAELLKGRIGLGAEAGALADAAELERLWPIVLEHSAAERTVPGAEGSPTWAQAFVGRFQVLIEEIETWEEGKALHAIVGRMGLMGAVGVALNARAELIRQRSEKTFNHVMEQILAAKDRAELEVAKGCGGAAAEERILTMQQLAELVAVARERWKKLPALHVESEADPMPAGGAGSILAPEGEEWEAFTRAADAADLSGDQIRALIDGHGDTPSAAMYGEAGLQRVADALARSHRRDHTIDNETRATLNQYLAESAEEFGFDGQRYRGGSE